MPSCKGSQCIVAASLSASALGKAEEVGVLGCLEQLSECFISCYLAFSASVNLSNRGKDPLPFLMVQIRVIDCCLRQKPSFCWRWRGERKHFSLFLKSLSPLSCPTAEWGRELVCVSLLTQEEAIHFGGEGGCLGNQGKTELGVNL